MKERIILHIDANNFYASVECSLNPKLKDKAICVSGNPKKRNGVILAKNQIAKKLGVKTGEPIWQAKEKCPDLICLPPRMSIYQNYSKKLQDIYKKYTHLVEPFGIDECWIDITDTAHLFGDSEKIARDIRKEVKDTLKITVSIGISFCKLFAKLGSDLKKPDAQTIISKENFKEIIYPLPITSIIGIGNRMEKHFNKLNIFKLGDFRYIPTCVLQKKIGVIGTRLKEKLLGCDVDPVLSSYNYDIPKSIGNGTTTIIDIFTRKEIKQTIIFLSDLICKRLRKQNLLSNSLSITIKNCKFECIKHSKKLPFSTNSVTDIVNFSIKFIDEFWKYDEKIRSIRISTRNLTLIDNPQLSIFQKEQDKKNNLNKSLDYLKNKYGKDIIKPASLYCANFINTSSGFLH